MRVMHALSQRDKGQEYTRTDLLRLGNIDPNPKSAAGYAGFEKTDYYLYKRGLIELVAMQGTQKVFRLTQKGKDWL
jgi:hypothetical protein